MNNSIQSTNFKGAFEINYRIARKCAKSSGHDVEAGLESLITDKLNSKIIRNWSGKDYKTFYIVDDSNDKTIANYISNEIQNLSFIYYPEINKTLKTNLSNNKILSFLSDRMTKRITNSQAMLQYIADDQSRHISLNTQEFDDIIKTILKNLFIEEFPGRQRMISGGITKIDDKYSIGRLRMSPPDKSGYRLVRVNANDIKAPVYRCKVDKYGNIIRYYISATEKEKFRESFNRNVRAFLSSNRADKAIQGD